MTAAGAGCSAKMKASYHLQRAERYFKAGEYQQSEIEYKNVLRSMPDNVEAWSRLGIIYCDQGRTLEAAPILARALQLDTNNLDLHLKLGAIYLGLGKAKAAQDEADFVLDQKPQDEQAPILLANASLAAGEISDSRQRLQKIYQTGETAPLDVALGILAFHQRDLKTAETFFKLAVARNPKFSDAYAALGSVYVLGKDFKQADQMFKTAADLAPVWSGNGIQYAQFKILTGDSVGGKQILQGIVKKEPSYLPAWLALAQLAAAEKKYDDSLTFIGDVLNRDPRNYEGLLFKSRIELLQGKTTQAITDLESMARIFPKTPVVLYQLAQTYLSNQQTDKAVSSLNQALNLDPKFVEATILLAQIQIRNGNAASAIVSLKQLTRQQPQLMQAQLVLADAYRAQDDPSDAIQIYQELEQSYPKDPQIPLLLGTTFYQQKQNAEARTEFDKALRLASDYLPALEQSVNLDLAERQYSSALQRVQHGLETNPNTAALQSLLGQILIAQGDTNRAEATLLKAIRLQPDYVPAYLMLAQLYVTIHQNTKALTELQTALDKNPNDVSASILMGMVYNSEEDYQNARDAYEKALVIAPNNPTILNNLACVYAEHLNQLDKGYELARQARSIAPADPAIADTLGWILYQKGQYDSALSLLRESVGKLYAVPDVQFHLGMTYYMMNNEMDAKTAFQRALQLNQNFSEKTECKQRLAVLDIDPKTAAPNTRAWLEKWTAKHPGDVIAFLRLAAIYQHSEMDDKAIAAYENAAKLSPQNAMIMENLASLYLPKDTTKGIAWGNAAYKLLPNDPEVSHLLGRLYFLSGDYKWALTLLQLTAQAEPQNPTVLFDLGKAYYSMGKVEQARTTMQNALQSGNAFAQMDDAKRFLAMTDLANRPLQALAMQAQIQEFLKSSPDYVPALMIEAAIAEQQTNLPTAQRIYADVLKRYPDFAPAQKRLAILYAKNPDDDSKAYPLAVKAHTAFPDDPEIAKALGIIVFRQGDYAHATGLLQESIHQMHQDPELLYYLGMAQYHLNHRLESKDILQKALDLNLSGEQAANAKRTLAELK